MATTMLNDVIDPQVMADMISGKLTNKIVATPYAAVDTTLVGVPGSTITVPRYNYIGDAEDVAEGVASEAAKLTASMAEVAVKKAVKNVEITDEVKLSAYGDPMGQTVAQITSALAAKVDADVLDALTGDGVQLKFNGAGKVISYAQIVDAIDVFGEELNTEKVIFVNPAQVTTLRKDADFLSADKYGTGVSVMVTGEVGTIANCHVVPSKRIAKTEAGTYECPIIKLQGDPETEDETAAVTVYMKRAVEFETARDVTRKVDVYSADEHYAVAVSNTSKVVLATFKA